MSHWLVLIIATITWIAWIPACAFARLVQGRSGGISILPAFPMFPLAAWGLAYTLHAAGRPLGVAFVGLVHLILLGWMILDILKSKRILRSRHRDDAR